MTDYYNLVRPLLDKAIEGDREAKKQADELLDRLLKIDCSHRMKKTQCDLLHKGEKCMYCGEFWHMSPSDLVAHGPFIPVMTGQEWYDRFAELLDEYDAVGIGEDSTAHYDVRIIHRVAAKAAGIE